MQAKGGNLLTEHDGIARRGPSTGRVFFVSFSLSPTVPQFTLITKVKAPLARVYDLARSVDLHLLSSGEEMDECTISGRSEGLQEEGETLTWKVGHLGNRQTMTTEVAEMEKPKLFREVMAEGEFKTFEHLRTFESDGAGKVTIMQETITYSLGFGILGKLVANLLLTAYIRESVRKHSNTVKQVAESESDWQKYLPDAPQED